MSPSKRGGLLRLTASCRCRGPARPMACAQLCIGVTLLLLSLQPALAGWTLSRATYYGAPEQVVRAYDPTRGEGSFGIVAFGSCGFTNLPKGDLPFPKETYAAAADANSDYPGSCGRCYEVRCKSGLVLDNDGTPIRLKGSNDSRAQQSVLYFAGDVFRPYLASINPDVPDDFGRRYPGNPTEPQGLATTLCYDEKKTVRVRIADSCPCKQVLPDGAPGVAKGGEVRRQDWCCGPLKHFDLAYWAFEQLAHPVSGVMMMESRPVDCDSGFPLPDNFISPVVYSLRGPEPGWNWLPTNATATLIVPGAGIAGGAATCVRLAERSKGGDLTFRSREAQRPGFQPFKGKQTLNFWIDSLPNVKLFAMSDTADKKQYCFQEIYISANTSYVVAREGKWNKFIIPIIEDGFRCQGALNPAELNRFDFQNIGEEEAAFCLTAVELM